MVKKCTVVMTTNAKLEFKGIIATISADNKLVAKKMSTKIKDGMEGLQQFPEMGRIVPELERMGNMQYRELIINPWRLVYQIKEEQVFVMAIIDERRNFDDIILKKLLLP
ncbi:MAG: type II toxin-antitoxin system RelE/ParE family toxin [Clostridiales Family XIII bacterium]|jgi:addiction module RelE/StbE family toxin|nr:type II toxin-antitoxin system RelE/ParE family toxin [Clostridiales Family XIII bacterium]